MLSSLSSLQNLPWDLQIAKNRLTELPLFEHEIKQRMYPAIYRMGEYIIKKREIGNEMYFLSQGTVEVCSGDGKTVYSIINKGSFFGELGVLFNVPRTASVRAFDDCYCMILTRDNLEVVLRYFPNIATRFRQVAESRMAEVKRMIQYKQMLEYQQKMEAVKEE
ncbi:cyclic nucleotide-binding-like protein [Chytriomyces sp. MP71]|nr:cyclic nucleotide-binding-like protein [Chytriomyces sp. MP71]